MRCSTTRSGGDRFSLAPDRLVAFQTIASSTRNSVFQVQVGDVGVGTPRFPAVPTLSVVKLSPTANGSQSGTFNVYNRTTDESITCTVQSYS